MDREVSEEVTSRLLAFVERMQDLLGVCDEHGRVLYMNRAAREHLGVTHTDGLTTSDFFAPEAFASYYDEVRPTLLRTGAWSGELPILARDGTSIPMQFFVVAGVAPGGEITGLVTHGRPLTYSTPSAGTPKLHPWWKPWHSSQVCTPPNAGKYRASALSPASRTNSRRRARKADGRSPWENGCDELSQPTART